ncbi:chromatin-remodeling complex subunit Ies6p [[Candida] anglica]|uniref:Chromatin-remodeling complex subunit Ies6p n=1 Tax=[Candida] anglica TaxID=148631 RepID=A0ABP0E7T5_9ASCO
MAVGSANSGASTSLPLEFHEISNVTTKVHKFKLAGKKNAARRYKPTKQVISDEVKYLSAKENIKFDTPTYTSLTAPPTLVPQKHYCDITGLPGTYKNPSNGLRYYNVEIYRDVIRNMPSGVDQEYLGLRGANVILK